MPVSKATLNSERLIEGCDLLLTINTAKYSSNEAGVPSGKLDFTLDSRSLRCRRHL